MTSLTHVDYWTLPITHSTQSELLLIVVLCCYALNFNMLQWLMWTLHSKTPTVGVPSICSRYSAWPAFRPQTVFWIQVYTNRRTLLQLHSCIVWECMHSTECVWVCVMCVYCILQALKRSGNLYNDWFRLLEFFWSICTLFQVNRCSSADTVASMHIVQNCLKIIVLCVKRLSFVASFNIIDIFIQLFIKSWKTSIIFVATSVVFLAETC